MTDPPYDTSDLTPAQAEAAFLVDASPGPNGVTPWVETGVRSAEPFVSSYYPPPCDCPICTSVADDGQQEDA